MSIQARRLLAYNAHIFFQRDSQRADILDVQKTRTELIAWLTYMVQQGWNMEITALVSDHHDDRRPNALPPYRGTHYAGFAVDMWPLRIQQAGKWIEADDPHFQKFLTAGMHGPYYMQTGLGGTANQPINQTAAGLQWFPDSVQDHVHFGTLPMQSPTN